MAPDILRALKDLIAEPKLSHALTLEKALIREGLPRKIFGRFNQRSSIEANSESDRGVAERLANAFDTSLTAARLSIGMRPSDRSLTPRVAAERFFAPNLDVSTWEPQDRRIRVAKPVIEFWEESPRERQRYRKFQPEDGLATVLVRDFGTGLSRSEMSGTILALNSDAKLRTFEAIGQFGHGGSSSLFFCESALAPEKSERLIVEGNNYGSFSFLAFVLPEPKDVRSYVDAKHPVIFTLNGQNHGETTSTLLSRANLPELSSTMIVEVRLDGLEQEALSHILSNSREAPKSSPFTRALVERLVELLREDEGLQEIELRRQEEKARQSSQELNKRLSQFISQILSDAVSRPAARGGSSAPGRGAGGGRVQTRPAIPSHDPPLILEFISGSRLVIPEGATYLAKFKSDARPPRYTFHGDNRRLFARYMPTSEVGRRVSIVGYAEINDRGYGSVSLHCAEDRTGPLAEEEAGGRLELTLQSIDGRVLTTSLEIGVAPKPEPKERARERDVEVQILFCALGGDPEGRYASLLNEQTIGDFGASLTKFKDALQLLPEECAYWAERFESEGANTLSVEINAANMGLVRLLESCATAEERVLAKERYCRDVALDAYQHCFRLDDMPETAWDAIQAQEDESKRAAEILLNHDKAIRFAHHERDHARRKRAT